MKLLFDQNLSHTLARALAATYPGSRHVRDLGMGSADDVDIWRYAADHGFAIATKDSDFHQLSLLDGSPPKVIWLRIGNCRTEEIESLLAERAEDMSAFDEHAEASFLVLSPTTKKP